ncbi:MAG: glycosyltransferase family 4 protein [Lachnospiraceae bacterium]|nr:glycosyltransferase family 4 protein [Lachnospiraceae bacterium]
MEKKTIALVIPWYGDSIRGGAEMECNSLAHSLSAAGYPVEVFTTCVKDAACDRGKNTMAPGLYMESGIPVRRFLVREERDVEKYDRANLRIYRNEPFTSEDEEIYFREDINSDEMYAYITENKENYRAFIFIPYMYGITYNGSSCCKEKSVLIPCLHDESYAYMQVLKKKMNEFRGMVFNAEPERELAKKLYGLDGVYTELAGVGIDTDWHRAVDPEAFRKKYGIQDEFILYAGRKDAGKKADELIRFFLQYKRDMKNKHLKLVLIGGGELPVLVPETYRSEVIDLGFVSVEDKHNAFAACTVFCNPSYFESFSIVIMEAWLAKRPVLVSAHCEVTTDFARKTNGGLWYENYWEFRECVGYLLSHRSEGREMGENGCRYVLENFAHGKIAEKYLAFVEECGL